MDAERDFDRSAPLFFYKTLYSLHFLCYNADKEAIIMKYTAQSGKYIFKNFFYIFPFAVLPAIFFSLSTDEQAIIVVLKAFFNGELNKWTFVELFRSISMLNFTSWQSGVFGFIGILVTVPCVALMMALLEKHMRIGKRSVNGIWSRLNDNLLSTCGYIFLLLLIFELWSLLAAAILYFVSMITVPVVAYVAIVIFFLLLHFLLLYVIGTIYLWLPCMQITGFRAFEALQYSYQIFSPVKWSTLWEQYFFLLLAEVLISLCALFIQGELVFFILTSVLYAFITLFYCVRMQIAYFDRDNMERADLKRYYND